MLASIHITQAKSSKITFSFQMPALKLLEALGQSRDFAN